MFIGEGGELPTILFKEFGVIRKKYEAIRKEKLQREEVKESDQAEAQEDYEDYDSEDEYEEVGKQYKEMSRTVYKEGVAQLKVLNSFVLDNIQLVVKKGHSEFAMRIIENHNQQLLASKVAYNDGAIVINSFVRESATIFFQNNQNKSAVRYIEKSNHKMLDSVNDGPWLEDIQPDVQKNVQFLLQNKQADDANEMMEQYNQKILSMIVNPGHNLSDELSCVLDNIKFLLKSNHEEIATEFVLQYHSEILKMVIAPHYLSEPHEYIYITIETLIQYGQADDLNKLFAQYNDKILKILNVEQRCSNYLEFMQPCVRDNITLMLKNKQDKAVDEFIAKYIQGVLDDPQHDGKKYEHPCIKENAAILLKYKHIGAFKEMQSLLKEHKNADKFAVLLPALEKMFAAHEVQMEIGAALDPILGIGYLADIIADYYGDRPEVAAAGVVKEVDEVKDGAD